MTMKLDHIEHADVMDYLRGLPDQCVNLIVTSPPYLGLRSYLPEGHPDKAHEIGAEQTPAAYIARMVDVFREVRRVLRDDGSIFCNLGDSYGPNKQLQLIPHRFAIAMQDDGWLLREDIVWCLSGGAWVYARTQKGDMPMMVRDMYRLDPKTVKLWNGQKWTQVLGMSRTPRAGEELELVLRSGERISCTPNHEWPTKRGLLRADQLRLGDVLETCTLPEPDVSLRPPHIGTDAAWFVGLYIAEGSRSNNALQIAGHTKEEARWERVQAIAKSYGGSASRTIDGNKMSIRVFGKMLHTLVDMFVSGRVASDKALNPIVWRYSNEWLRALLDGYLSGDGHYDAKNDRWRIGFTRNYGLERDLRILAARLGLTLTLKMSHATMGGRLFPTFRGELRFGRNGHRNERPRSEVVEIRMARCREVYEIGVEDEPHVYALASGVLTHNCKPNPMPESVRDRCTRSHEYIFHFTKQPRYWYDAQAVAEEAVDTSPGGRFTTRQADGIGRAPTGNQLPERSKAYVRKPERNRRSVWTINPANFRDWTETVRRHPVSVHELSGGTKRIASPDCPVHGSKDRPGSIYVCDAHEADELSRNAGIYARRVQAQFAGSASTDQNHVSGLQEQSSGLLPPDRVPSATLHNTQSHRTAPAPATTLPYTPSGETASHTGDTSTEPAYVAPHPDTLVNSTSQGAPDAHSPGQTSGDTVGILSSVSLPCTCQFYRETTEKTSHFATFPEDIPEICILAACPEWCCDKCGAPYEAQVEKESNWAERRAAGATGGTLSNGHNTTHGRGISHDLGTGAVRHNGYAPSCSCNAGKRAGVVLDPFMGAGTVALVAKRLNRRYIGCDLNAEYVEMARRRIDSIPYTLFSLMNVGD